MTTLPITPSLRDFWIQVLRQLQPTIKKSDFLTFFKDTTILRRAEGVVTIGFANVFTRDWTANKYRQALLDIFQQIDPLIEQVEFDVDGKLGQPDDTRAIDIHQLEMSVKKVRKLPNREEYTVTTDGLRSKTLNPKYTLENYIIGSENRLAHAACMAVSKRPGTAYNPLFIYGGVGLGKTHLLQATGNGILKYNPQAVIAYMTSERFMNEIVDAIQKQKSQTFKAKYRNLDCLIIDDIQFMAGKERTSEEFFHTFNELYDANRQIIISADRPPKELTDLEDRLTSRFEMGMIVDVQFPDYETRLAILHAKCREHQVIMPPDVLDFIAYNVHHSIRELEGVLLQAIAQYELEQSTPTVRMVAEILKKLHRDGHFAILEDGREHRSLAKTPEDVITLVADYFKLTKSDLVGEVRKKEILLPRQIAMYLIRKELDASFEQVGEAFGKNHTTVMHAVDKVVALLRKDQKVVRDVNAVKGQMGL